MSQIRNIGVLDVREVQEDVAKKIKEIKNIGMLIESHQSQVLLKEVKKSNIGSTLKLPDNVNLVMQNGELKIDKEYLDGIIGKVVFLVNGMMTFSNDIDIQTLNEKVHSVVVNGELICPKKLSGSIQSRGTINGLLTGYSSDYIFFNERINLTNRFIKSMRKGSKLSFNKLMVLEPIDFELLEEKISNIEIIGRLVVLDNFEEDISQYIDNYYSIRKTIIPNIGNEFIYIDKKTTLNNESIIKYSEAVLYVDGEVRIQIDEPFEFGKHIKLLICRKITCNEKTYQIIKDNIGDNVEIDIVEGKLLENTGNLVLSGTIEEKLTIRNMGKLVFDENLDYDSFVKNVHTITNYGLIVAPEDKIPIIEDKVKENKGKISSAKEKEKQITEKEDILYENIGELKL